MCETGGPTEAGVLCGGTRFGVVKVMVIGAAGRIGRVVDDGLRGLGHECIAVDRVGATADHPGAWELLDCCDHQAVAAVVGRHQPDAVVHVAGHPGEQALEPSLRSHVVSTAAVLDAMVTHSVRRIVYASSNHAVGRTPEDRYSPSTPVPADVAPRPDTNYGVAKVAAEALLSL